MPRGAGDQAATLSGQWMEVYGMDKTVAFNGWIRRPLGKGPKVERRGFGESMYGG